MVRVHLFVVSSIMIALSFASIVPVNVPFVHTVKDPTARSLTTKRTLFIENYPTLPVPIARSTYAPPKTYEIAVPLHTFALTKGVPRKTLESTYRQKRRERRRDRRRQRRTRGEPRKVRPRELRGAPGGGLSGYDSVLGSAAARRCCGLTVYTRADCIYYCEMGYGSCRYIRDHGKCHEFPF